MVSFLHQTAMFVCQCYSVLSIAFQFDGIFVKCMWICTYQYLNGTHSSVIMGLRDIRDAALHHMQFLKLLPRRFDQIGAVRV